MNRTRLSEQEFIEAVRTHLDESIASLAPALSKRLESSRCEAVASWQKKSDHLDDAIAVDDLALDVKNPPHIEARLDEIRKQAVAKLEHPQLTNRLSWLFRLPSSLASVFQNFNFGATATVFATACVMVTAISLFYVSFRPNSGLSVDEEFNLVASADDLELYENLEFYLWLAENEL